MPSTVERSILTIIDPVIKLDTFAIPDLETSESEGYASTQKVSKMLGTIFPAIEINGYFIKPQDFIDFELVSGGFLPVLNFRFFDSQLYFANKQFPQDGQPIKVHLKSNGDEKTFKPIRCDFTIERIVGVDTGIDGRMPIYTVRGKLRIPNLFNEFQESYEGTSYDSLLQIAENLELGFASNLDSTNDSMIWLNPNDTREKFIRDITANSYVDDNTFLSSYIDPYYYLTLVNPNVLFDVNEELDLSYMYSTSLLETQQGQDPNEGASAPVFLTNHVSMQGSTSYITKYTLTNLTGFISDKNGYKRYVQTYDFDEKEFISEFVDPLTTEGTDGYVHLKGRYVGPPDNRIVEGIAQSQSKYRYMGIQDADNLHSEYHYSSILNYQNLQEIQKMGMVVDLLAVNTTLYRNQRILIQMYDSLDTLNNSDQANEAASEVQAGDYSENNDPASKEIKGQAASQTINKFLTGFYVIDEIRYRYTGNGPMTMQLKLIRREFEASA
jgi:hypothetical protein